MTDGEDTGLTVVYGDHDGSQVHFGFVSFDGGFAFLGSCCLRIHVCESGLAQRSALID